MSEEVVVEQVEEPTTTNEAAEQLAAEVVQKKMAGLSDDEIKEYFIEKYGMDEDTANETLQLIMNYLNKKSDQEFQIKKGMLGVIPAIAQSNNPLAPLALQSLIEKAGLKEEESFAKELVEMQKEVIKAKLAAEMMKEMNLGGSGGQQTDPLLAKLIESTLKDSKEKEQMLFQLLLERMQDTSAEQMQQIIQALSESQKQAIEALNQKLEAILMSQGQNVQVENKDALGEMVEFQEKLKKLTEAMKAMGFDIKPPGAKDEDPTKLFEQQLKLKELELKQKEIESRQIFYAKLAETLSNPQTIQIIFNGLSQLIGGLLNRGAPNPAMYGQAMMQAAQVPMANPTPPQGANVEPIKPPESVPSLDDFLKEEEVAENANGQD